MQKPIKMYIEKMTPTGRANEIKLAGKTIGDKTRPIEIDFIPEKHGIEHFPRVGQKIKIIDRDKIEKIVYFSMPKSMDEVARMDEDEFREWQRSVAREALLIDAMENIRRAPAEIQKALGIPEILKKYGGKVR